MKEHIKVFTGNNILTNRLAYLLDEANIPSLIKDNKESSRLAGFGDFGQSVELFIYETDFDKAKAIIESFKEEIKY